MYRKGGLTLDYHVIQYIVRPVKSNCPSKVITNFNNIKLIYTCILLFQSVPLYNWNESK